MWKKLITAARELLWPHMRCGVFGIWSIHHATPTALPLPTPTPGVPCRQIENSISPGSTWWLVVAFRIYTRERRHNSWRTRRRMGSSSTTLSSLSASSYLSPLQDSVREHTHTRTQTHTHIEHTSLIDLHSHIHSHTCWRTNNITFSIRYLILTQKHTPPARGLLW